MQMTKYDVKNYLEKIYDVKTVAVRTRIAIGKTRVHEYMKCVVKDEDVKVAYAILVSLNNWIEETCIFPRYKNSHCSSE